MLVPASGSTFSVSCTLGTDTGTGIGVDSSGKIYLSKFGNGYNGNGAVEVFAAGTTGSTTPIGTIAGAAANMFQPEGVAFDASGNIYVSQFEGPAITVYPAGTTNGNVAPIRTIYGAAHDALAPRWLGFRC